MPTPQTPIQSCFDGMTASKPEAELRMNLLFIIPAAPHVKTGRVVDSVLWRGTMVVRCSFLEKDSRGGVLPAGGAFWVLGGFFIAALSNNNKSPASHTIKGRGPPV